MRWVIYTILKVKPTNNTNLVKLVSNSKNEVMYISRANIPYEFKNKSKVSVDVSSLTGQFVFLISLDGVEQKKTSIIIQ